MSAVAQPSGTVTMVFTDIEGSTRLLEELGRDAYLGALAEHRRVVREACARHEGYEVAYEGDTFFYAFASAQAAVSAVSEAMAGLQAGPIRIRVGIHTGEPGLDPPKYVGMDVHRAARIMSAAHGGQVVLSPSTASSLEPESFAMRDLGEHRFKDIEAAIPIFQLGDTSFPPLKTISNTNLPRPASSFVGREAELAEVLSRIEDGARLVTLTGPGGTGKTRLALEAATALVPSYKAGVFWVGLASLRDAGLVSETIAQTLGAKDGLAEHIAERELLLLLDNLEQVIEAAPELSALLQACPNLTMLVTSRELLRIQGELEYPVSPLAKPEAVSLFCERAQTEPTDQITELCARLDNLPLAVELAAARTKVLSPAQILERLSSRLDLLKGGRDTDPRQQTLRATIEWSYDLLTKEEQRLFRALSVFAGGCTLDAAEAVAEADLDTMQSLVEKNLVRFTNERYSMLETIGELAADCLETAGETEELRRRHAECFLAYAAMMENAVRGGEQKRAFAALRLDDANLLLALSLEAGAGHSEQVVAAAVALGPYWENRGNAGQERAMLERALSSAGEMSLALRASGLYYAARLAYWHGDSVARAIELLQESLVVARGGNDRTGEARALAALGFAAAASGGDLDAALESSETGLRLARQAEDRHVIRLALNNLAIVLDVRGEIRSALPLYEECIALTRETGDLRGWAAALMNVSKAFAELGDTPRARAAAQEAVAVGRDLEDVHVLAGALACLGHASLLAGDVVEANAVLREALAAARDAGEGGKQIWILETLGSAAAASQEWRRAASLWAVSESACKRFGLALDRTDLALRERFAPLVEQALRSEELAELRAQASAWTLNDTVEELLYGLI